MTDNITESGSRKVYPAELDSFLKRSWPVFPLVPGTKRPAIGDWAGRASHDPATVADWALRFPGCNWALHLGGCPGHVSVVDLDGPTAEAEYVRRYGAAGDTLRVATPRGGAHLYFQGDATLANTVRRLGDNIDTRGAGGYVLVPGSVVDGKRYSFTGNPAAMPTKIPASLSSAMARQGNTTFVQSTTLDSTRNVAMAIRYLDHAAPCAVEGAGGDHTTYVVACSVREYGISEEQCAELMLEHWNDEKAFPPWDPGQLTRKVGNAYRYAQSALGEQSWDSRIAEAAAAFDDECADPFDEPPGFVSVARTVADLYAEGDPPPRVWLIENWIPGEDNTHTYLTGRGGTGKSLLALQIGIAVGGGFDTLWGARVTHRPTKMFLCEDSWLDVRHRLRAMGNSPVWREAMLNSNFSVVSRVGEESNLLVVQDGPVLNDGPFWKQLVAEINSMPAGPRLVILDTVGDIYGGDQNDNQLVQQFLKARLNRLAFETQATFILLGHPAKAVGSQYGGAVAWENGVRNRLFLDWQNPEQPGGRLSLVRAKSNWVGPGEKIHLRYEGGIHVQVSDADLAITHDDAVFNAIQQAAIADRPYHRSSRASRFIGKAEIRSADGSVMTSEEITAAADRLIDDDKVEDITGQREGNGLFPAGPTRIFGDDF